MKKPLTLLPILLFPLLTSAQEPAVSSAGAAESPDSVFVFRYEPGQNRLMRYIPGSQDDNTNMAAIDRLCIVLKNLRNNGGDPAMWVDNYSDASGDQIADRRVAAVRSNRVKSEIIVRRQAREADFTTRNHAGTYAGMTDVVVVRLFDPEAVAEQPTPGPVVEPVPVTAPEPVPEPEPMPEPVSAPMTEESAPAKEKRCMGLDLRTNLLYDALLVPTLGLEWHVTPSVGIKVDGSWSHWGGSHGKCERVWLVNPELRWYMGHSKRFYLGASGNVGKYNVYGYPIGWLLPKDKGYQGTLWGAGFTAGYYLPFCSSWGMDFNLGLGYTRYQYDSFALVEGTRTYIDKDRTKNFWGPTQAGVSLVWKFIK